MSQPAAVQDIIRSMLTRFTMMTATEMSIVSGVEYGSLSEALLRMERRGLVLKQLDRKTRVTATSERKIYRYKLWIEGTARERARQERRLARQRAAAAYRQTPERAAELRAVWSEKDAAA